MGKNQTKIISVITVLMLLVSMFTLSVSAYDKDVILSSKVVVAYDVAQNIEPVKSNSVSYQKAYNMAVDAIKNVETSVNVASCNFSVNQMKALCKDLIYKNPEFFYLDKSIAYNYYLSTNTVADITFNYLFTESEIIEKQKTIDKITDYVVYQTSNMKTDVEKALFVNDYLALNCEYDNKVYEGLQASEMSYSMYGCLVDNLAVCQGYTLAYIYLLDKIGIESVSVDSDSMNHVWNLVKIDGYWYHVDVTWNDPVYDILGRVSHKNFLVSDKKISTNHEGYVTQYKASNSKYDTAFWQKVNSAIKYKDGYMYYFTDNKELIKRDYSKNTTEKIPYTDDTWYIGSEKKYFYPGNFARIVTDTNKIYYNTSKEIYSMNFDGSQNKVIQIPTIQSGRGIYGLGVVDGYLCYSTSTSPNEDDRIYKTNIKIEEKAPLMGDLNNDGVLTILDVFIFKNHFAGVLKLSESQIKAGDLSGDGAVRLIDVFLLQRILASVS